MAPAIVLTYLCLDCCSRISYWQIVIYFDIHRSIPSNELFTSLHWRYSNFFNEI